MVDFQIGNGRHERYTAHFLFENRPMSDFQIGNGEEWKFGTGTGPIWNMHAPGRPAGPAEVWA